MKGYRPSIDHLKREYSRMLARKRMLEQSEEKRGGLPKVRTPDNSEPYLPHPARSFADCVYIATEATKRVEEWKKSAMPRGL